MLDLDRRALLKMGLGAGALAALAGCGGGSGGGSGGTSARVAWYGGDPVHTAMDAALAAFTAANAGVDLSTERAPYDDYWDKLATQTAGGTGPDVFRMSMAYFTEYAQRGALRDLSGAAISTDGFDEDVATSGQLDDGLFGIGQSSITHAAFVNPAPLQALGAQAPASGWTWDDFATFSRDYAAAAGSGQYGSDDAGGNIQIFEVFARQHGSEVFGPEGLAVGQDVIEEWFAFWEALRRDGAAPPPDVTVEAAGFDASTLATGLAPVQFGWVQQITFYQPLLPDQPLEIVAVPSGPDGTLAGQFVKALDFWCVSEGTGSPELSEQLVDFLLNDETAVKEIGVTLGVPPSSRSRELLGADPSSPEGKTIAFIEEVADQVGPSPEAWPQGYGELQSTFTRVNEDIAFGRSDPAAGAAFMGDEATRVLGS